MEFFLAAITVPCSFQCYYNEKFRQNLEGTWINTGVKVT